ncbi:sel1 repeat family protein [Ferrimonas sediminicola]|uniref:Sel1 repeat family protein n=1 Tax=Ferrimonas sediminicola TaxID=2569538 RepID=A0A4U1BC97_9GAMM|nr:SEL1-like repeat protein [Ferrimonas sediminicola]TKB48283.1 sel1 repeat family protein [Ferrimonas sediminicola]
MSKFIVAGILASLLLAPARAEERADQLAQARQSYAQGDLIGAIGGLERAAESGSAEARGFLAYILFQSGQVAPALVMYRQAADAGDGFALVRLAELKLTGRGVDADPAGALEMLQQALDKGRVEAGVILAGVYESGLPGTEPNPSLALAYYQQAAESGDQDAIGRLIRVYAQGGLGEQADQTKLAYWQAAMQRLSDEELAQ